MRNKRNIDYITQAGSLTGVGAFAEKSFRRGISMTAVSSISGIFNSTIQEVLKYDFEVFSLWCRFFFFYRRSPELLSLLFDFLIPVLDISVPDGNVGINCRTDQGFIIADPE